MSRDPRRHLPSVDVLLRSAWRARFGDARAVDACRRTLDAVRSEIASGARDAAPDLATLRRRVESDLRTGVSRVINATGVVLHTNLGRAPWGPGARAAALDAMGSCAVEFDLATGVRGGRGRGAESRLCALTGAEAALVVNNGAAALVLAMASLAAGREVLVSRGELVEIGGGFRVPDVLAASGARLVEVGTTNRTHLRDYEAAMSADVAAIVRVHHSNFRQIGFVTQPTMSGLAGLGVPLVADLGSGVLTPPHDDPDVASALTAGAGLVCFSGDKLLGGPQAGLVVGRAALVARLRRHPLFRALRPCKVTLAGLEGTFDDRLRGLPTPVQTMIAAPIDELAAEVERWRSALAIRAPSLVTEVVAVQGAVGGGALPGRTWPSQALVIRSPSPVKLRAALLEGRPPVVGRVRDDALWLDARTVVPVREGDALVAALVAAARQVSSA